MILLDSNVLVIDIKYTTDKNFARNQQALAELMRSGDTLAVTTQVVIEVVGVMCFNLSAADILKAWPKVRRQ